MTTNIYNYLSITDGWQNRIVNLLTILYNVCKLKLEGALEEAIANHQCHCCDHCRNAQIIARCLLLQENVPIGNNDACHWVEKIVGAQPFGNLFDWVDDRRA